MTMTVQVRSMGGQVSVEVPDNATVGDVRRAAAKKGLQTEGLSIKAGGQDAGEGRQVSDQEVLVAIPPKAKQG